MCNAQSKDFAVPICVKQGCVLALTRFSLCLTAMLEVAFRSTEEGVYIQTWHNADLFNASTSRPRPELGILVKELIFAEDSAITAHTAEDSAAKSFSLTMNIKKLSASINQLK